jgi:hypothetical protein
MTSSKRSTQAEPHPASEHRTPREIAADEAGPIGEPDLDVVAERISDADTTRFPAARRAPSAGSSRKPGNRK